MEAEKQEQHFEITTTYRLTYTTPTTAASFHPYLTLTFDHIPPPPNKCNRRNPTEPR